MGGEEDREVKSTRPLQRGFFKWNWIRFSSADILFTKRYLPLESEMSLKIRKTSDGLYEATATPPHVKTAWSTSEPISARRLIDELKSLGAHQQDIGDALSEQDPDWVRKL